MISFRKFCWKKRGKKNIDPNQKSERNHAENLFVAPKKLGIYKEIERYLLQNHVSQTYMDRGVQTDTRPSFEVKQICTNSKRTERIENSEEKSNMAQNIINSETEKMKICSACILKPRRKWGKERYLCCKYEGGIFEEFPFVNTSANMRDKISTEMNTEGKYTDIIKCTDIIKSRIKTEIDDSVVAKIIGTQTINQNQDINDLTKLTNFLSNNLPMKMDTANAEETDKVGLDTDAEYSEQKERKLDTIHEEEDQTHNNTNLNGSSMRSEAEENWRDTIEIFEAEEQENKKLGQTGTPEYIALTKIEEIENVTEDIQDFKEPSEQYAITEKSNFNPETEKMSDENSAMKRNSDTYEKNDLDTNIATRLVSSVHSSEEKSDTTLEDRNLSILNNSSYTNEANLQLDVIQNNIDHLATESVNNKKFTMHRPQLAGSAAQIPLNWSNRKGKRSVYRECNCGCERISKICCPMNIHGNFICCSAVASKSRSSCCMRHVRNVPGNLACGRGLCVDVSENTDSNKSHGLPWTFQAINEQSQTEYTTFAEISLNRCSTCRGDSSFSSFHWSRKRQPQCQLYRDGHFEQHCTRNSLNSHNGLNLYYTNTQPNESYFMRDNTFDRSRLIVSRFSVTRDVPIRPAIMNYCYSFNGH